MITEIILWIIGITYGGIVVITIIKFILEKIYDIFDWDVCLIIAETIENVLDCGFIRGLFKITSNIHCYINFPLSSWNHSGGSRGSSTGRRF